MVQGNLLDFTTPGTNRQDAPLQIGASFFDTASGVTLKPLAKGGTTPNEYLDIEIDFFPHIDWQSTSFAVDQQAGSATVTLAAHRRSEHRDQRRLRHRGRHREDARGLRRRRAARSRGPPATALRRRSSSRSRPNPNRTGITNFTVTLSNPVNALLGTATTTVSIAAAGLNDPLFAPNNFNSSINKILRQPDGKLLVAGNFSPYSPNGTFVWGGGFTRLNPDGSLDAGLL